MKACRLFGCFFGVLLCCTLYWVKAAEDDLLDFDFSDLKEIDWDYNGSSSSSSSKSTKKITAAAVDNKLQNNLVTFEDNFDEENQVHPFDWRERILRTALSKALTNSGLRQKFVEVMPILRVLSSQQRLALSALISAQVNARQGQELKLEQVRMMFGNDKKLLIPIVYDIANLVRNSARTFLQFDNDIVPSSELRELQIPMTRRNFELTAAEDAAERNMAAKISSNLDFDVDVSLEDFLTDMPKDVMDPKSINEQLQSIKSSTKAPFKIKLTTTTTTAKPVIHKRSEKLHATRRRRRSASAQATEFVHKLIRSIPLSVNDDDLMKGAAGRTMKLNTTAFYSPYEGEQQIAKKTTLATTTSTAAVTFVTPTPTTSTDQNAQQQLEPHQPTYQEVENLAFASLNSSEITLSAGVATNTTQGEEPLPNPEELIAGPRYRFGGHSSNRLRGTKVKTSSKRKRVQVRARPKSQLSQSAAHTPVVLPKKCERFTASMCLRSDDYPL